MRGTGSQGYTHSDTVLRHHNAQYCTLYLQHTTMHTVPTKPCTLHLHNAAHCAYKTVYNTITQSTAHCTNNTHLRTVLTTHNPAHWTYHSHSHVHCSYNTKPCTLYLQRKAPRTALTTSDV